MRLVYKIDLTRFCASVVGKVKELKGGQIFLKRKEIALVTLKGLSIFSDQKQLSGDQYLQVTIHHFQIDNQTEFNPLFQQIFVPKVYVGSGLIPRAARFGNMRN